MCLPSQSKKCLFHSCRFCFLAAAALFVLIAAGSASARTQVSIGMIIDGHNGNSRAFIRNLQGELTRLLGTKYAIAMKDTDVLSADWSAANAKRLYRQLSDDPRINIVIGAGAITTTVLAAETAYPKPVIALGVLDPNIQGIPPATDNRSGIHNFTYVLFNRSRRNDISHFHDLVPFSKVAVIASEELLNLVSAGEMSMQLGDSGPVVTLMPLPVPDTPDDLFLSRAADAEAAYISYLGRLTREEKQAMIQALTDRGIPTFGSSLTDAHLGALAAIAPDENWTSLVRRLALNVEAILAGRNASELAVQIDFTESLTINMRTARRLGISPAFSILSQATLIHEFDDGGSPVTTLMEAMETASRMSTDVEIEESSVTIAEQDLSLAKSGWRPTLNATGNYTVIDRDTADASFGMQAERTSAGTLSAQQIIYSDDLAGNITASRHLLDSARSGLVQVQLDSMLTAARAYLNILKAKTAITIHQENVVLTNQNLAIAKKREVIGYSGLSDVYRWQSRLAGAQTDLFAAKNSYRLTMNELNRILNRPLQEVFTVSEPVLSGTFIENRTAEKIRTLANTQASLETLTLFFIEEAMRNAPEIQQLDAAIAASERRLLSYERKRYLPVVNLNAQGQHVFSRDGAGSSLPGVDYLDDSWNAGLNMSWSLFQGGAIGSNISKARSEITRLKKQKHQLARLIQINVRASLMDLTNSSVNRDNSKRASDFARKSLALVKDDYEKGRVAVVELLDAQNSALTADLAALNSEYDFLISQLTLERSIGYFTQLKSADENRALLKRIGSFFGQSAN